MSQFIYLKLYRLVLAARQIIPSPVRGERRGEGKTMFPNSFPATGWLLRADLRAAKNKDDECWRSKVVHDIWGM